MGSLAVLAKELGYEVSGSDQNVYPPMSTQLEEQGIALSQGYDPAHFSGPDAPRPDMIVIGNTCSRGNPAVEYILENNLPYCSGPQWLSEHVLQDRWVLAVAGTHGKTTTTSMLTWILEYAGLEPGYLVGGVPKNFSCSARLGKSPFFVIEADEYDSAFFDKRSKFVHYRAKTAILGNLEYDHADIFPDLGSIQTQFHHLLKTIPQNGLVIAPLHNKNLEEVFARGLWSEKEYFDLQDDPAAQWRVKSLDKQGSHYRVTYVTDDGEHSEVDSGEVNWELLGEHNIQNGVAALAAAAHAGVSLQKGCAALSAFAGVKRRLELLGEFAGVKIYDDFAHHPTAIKTTLDGFRARLDENGESGRLICVIEARSNTMKMGYHQKTLAASLDKADLVIWYKSEATKLDLASIASDSLSDFRSYPTTDEIIDELLKEVVAGDHVIIMSNGGFEGIHGRLGEALGSRH
ncbi:MAG: UDP-N-acetylmuramate: L-alanyl-gamma-D-glutamyl-meso-diaminopimelate ligase [Pseudohongiellaceae bacterium]|jgi:UDP-N-acetylmuramate: L-alanyl-gamma-D-glutamyl-meso-diaminopimelate ligase